MEVKWGNCDKDGEEEKEWREKLDFESEGEAIGKLLYGLKDSEVTPLLSNLSFGFSTFSLVIIDGKNVLS